MAYDQHVSTIENWSASELGEFLGENNFEDFCSFIENNQVDGEQFLSLTPTQVNIWRVNTIPPAKVAARKKNLISFINNVNRNPERYIKTKNKRNQNFRSKPQHSFPPQSQQGYVPKSQQESPKLQQGYLPKSKQESPKSRQGYVPKSQQESSKSQQGYVSNSQQELPKLSQSSFNSSLAQKLKEELARRNARMKNSTKQESQRQNFRTPQYKETSEEEIQYEEPYRDEEDQEEYQNFNQDGYNDGEEIYGNPQAPWNPPKPIAKFQSPSLPILTKTSSKTNIFNSKFPREENFVGSPSNNYYDQRYQDQARDPNKDRFTPDQKYEEQSDEDEMYQLPPPPYEEEDELYENLRGNGNGNGFVSDEDDPPPNRGKQYQKNPPLLAKAKQSIKSNIIISTYGNLPDPKPNSGQKPERTKSATNNSNASKPKGRNTQFSQPFNPQFQPRLPPKSSVSKEPKIQKDLPYDHEYDNIESIRKNATRFGGSIRRGSDGPVIKSSGGHFRHRSPNFHQLDLPLESNEQGDGNTRRGSDESRYNDGSRRGSGNSSRNQSPNVHQFGSGESSPTNGNPRRWSDENKFEGKRRGSGSSHRNQGSLNQLELPLGSDASRQYDINARRGSDDSRYGAGQHRGSGTMRRNKRPFDLPLPVPRPPNFEGTIPPIPPLPKLPQQYLNNRAPGPGLNDYLTPIEIEESANLVTLQEELNANWYQDISRKESEDLLFGAMDGAFVFRRTGQSGCLCTLTIMYEGILYHLNVRIKSSNMLALGKHRKEEAEFGNLDEIVSYYSENELKLIQGAGFALVRFQPHVIYEYNQYNY